jgi:hypothetical protein
VRRRNTSVSATPEVCPLRSPTESDTIIAMVGINDRGDDQSHTSLLVSVLVALNALAVSGKES